MGEGFDFFFISSKNASKKQKSLVQLVCGSFCGENLFSVIFVQYHRFDKTFTSKNASKH